jgi:hypothetical protein
MEYDAGFIEMCAETCHMTVRAYGILYGQKSLYPWRNTSVNMKESVRAGVRRVLMTPNILPEDMHEAWIKYRTAQGWTQGPVKNEKTKEHPNLVPYEELPDTEKSKDVIFIAIVESLARHYTPPENENLDIRLDKSQ